MICARPGCTNEVTATNTMGPRPRFCDDKECRRQRRNAGARLHYDRVAGKVPKFKAKGIKKEKRHGQDQSVSVGIGGRVRSMAVALKATDPQGSEGSNPSLSAKFPQRRLVGRAAARAVAKPIAQSAKANPDASIPAHADNIKISDGKMSLVDREAKLAGIDRGTRDGFTRYMEERPFYFGMVFPGKTIAQAWGMVGGR